MPIWKRCRDQRRVDSHATGIRERQLRKIGVASSDLATAAAKELLAQTGTDPAEIDLIVLASVTPTCFSLPLPAWCRTALAQKGLGLRPFRRVLGFAYALTVGAQFVAPCTQKSHGHRQRRDEQDSRLQGPRNVRLVR